MPERTSPERTPPESSAGPLRVLVLGGARSGKSAFAQAQAETSSLERVFVATAEPFDDEMRERISRHVAARGPGWRTIETPYDLSAAVGRESAADRILLVDCLTVWLGNLMIRDADVDAAVDALSNVVAALAGPAIFVSNEVGMGIVPETALGRRFRDAQGRLNQRMSQLCDSVVMVTAGIPRLLKPAPAVTLGLP